VERESIGSIAEITRVSRSCRSPAFYFVVSSAIQVATAHPRFDLYVGESTLHDPEALSRLRDEHLRSLAGSASRYKAEPCA